jgi:hypothetical protein
VPAQGSVTANPYIPVVYWGPRNSARLPLYHRLDVSLGRRFAAGPLVITVEASVINLYDRKNIYTVITVIHIVFDLTEFDFALSRYYASVNGYLDRYSVWTNESIYSNVSGGIGIFGSRMDSKYSYPMDRKYVESFGYRYAGPN